MTFSMSLPWPPSELSPNRRMHWAKLAKAKKGYRASCCGWTHSRLPRCFRLVSGQFDLSLRFRPPNRRSYDRDNLLARMKAGIDGMCDALGIDDKRFQRVTVEVGEPVKGGAVEVTITEGRP